MVSPLYPAIAGLSDQLVNITTVAGAQMIPLSAFDDLHLQFSFKTLFYGIRIGSSCLLFVMQFLFTRNYRQPVFIFNQICLFLIFVQSILFYCYIVGPFGQLSNLITGSFAGLTDTDVNVSIMASVFQLILIYAIELSLLFQAHLMFKESVLMGRIVTVLMFLFNLVPTVVIWTIYFVASIQNVVDPSNLYLYDHIWVSNAPRPLLGASIFFYSLLSAAKMFVVIRRRRAMGLTQFGPFQILFIMAMQTMIVPVVLSFIEFAVSTHVHEDYSDLSILVVVVFLPLSTMWAKFKSTSDAFDTFKFLTPRTSRSSSLTFVPPSPGSEKAPRVLTGAALEPARSQQSDNTLEAGIGYDYNRIFTTEADRAD